MKKAKKKPIKKPVKKTRKPAKKQATKKKKSAVKKEKKVGKIIHFYGKISVAIIKLLADLKKGETVHIKGGSADFYQKIASMEIDHEKVVRAKKGAIIGLKVKSDVREGAELFK